VDFFTVPTARFDCFLSTRHRARIVPLQCPCPPNFSWVVQRLREAPEKDTPNQRPIEHQPSPAPGLISKARRGGLHHRFSWRQAA
jgi:hypothetical protein